MKRTVMNQSLITESAFTKVALCCQKGKQSIISYCQGIAFDSSRYIVYIQIYAFVDVNAFTSMKKKNKKKTFFFNYIVMLTQSLLKQHNHGI